MKKIISFVLAAAMSLSSLPVLADWNNDEDIMSLLSELNIMVGDDDGNLIGYYEKHEYRNNETMKKYDFK